MNLLSARDLAKSYGERSLFTNVGFTIEAVSYTHLDVYKRQLHRKRLLFVLRATPRPRGTLRAESYSVL